MLPLVQLAIETAMRQGKLLALAWDNVDLKAQTARLEDTKNGESRTVPLSSHAVAVLEALPRGSGMDGRVFPISAQAVKLAWILPFSPVFPSVEAIAEHDRRPTKQSPGQGRRSSLIEPPRPADSKHKPNGDGEDEHGNLHHDACLQCDCAERGLCEIAPSSAP